jgi:hypothetical protein
MTDLRFQVLCEAYQPVRDTKRSLLTDLQSLGLDEIEAIHLTNRFASGKFPDARERILTVAPDVGSWLDDIDEVRARYEGILAQSRGVGWAVTRLIGI